MNQKMSVKFLLASLLLLFVSCSNFNTYVRFSDMHHVDYAEIEVHKIGKDSVELRDLNIGNSIEQTSIKICLSDTNFSFKEGKKVIKYNGSYYVKKSVKNKRILSTYYNHDIKF